MAQPKKQSSPRKTGLRRSHLRLKLARAVNAKSPVKVKTTKRETGKKKQRQGPSFTGGFSHLNILERTERNGIKSTFRKNRCSANIV